MATQADPSTTPARAVLHVEGAEVEGDAIPADLLLTLVGAMQETALVVGASRERRDFRHRFKPDAVLRERYTLRVKLPERGSYAIPFEHDGRGLPAPAGADEPADFLDHCLQVITAVAQGSEERLGRLMPDSRLRDRVVRSARNVIPAPGRSFSVGFQSGGEDVVLDAHARARAEELVAAPGVNESALTTVTGEVLRIDFSSRSMTLRYAPTGRSMVVVYDPAEEDDILQWRHAGALQVTGIFEVDDDAHPVGLIEKVSVHPIDLSPVVLSTVTWRKRQFVFDTPLVLTPRMDEDSGQLMVVEDVRFGLHSYACTRDQLVREVEGEIVFNFDRFAKAADETLAPDALSVARVMRAHIREGGI